MLSNCYPPGYPIQHCPTAMLLGALPSTGQTSDRRMQHKRRCRGFVGLGPGGRRPGAGARACRTCSRARTLLLGAPLARSSSAASCSRACSAGGAPDSALGWQLSTRAYARSSSRGMRRVRPTPRRGGGGGATDTDTPAAAAAASTYAAAAAVPAPSAMPRLRPPPLMSALPESEPPLCSPPPPAGTSHAHHSCSSAASAHAKSTDVDSVSSSCCATTTRAVSAAAASEASSNTGPERSPTLLGSRTATRSAAAAAPDATGLCGDAAAASSPASACR
eukprot:364823-Chlamydomonas_euryale.AAC.6